MPNCIAINGLEHLPNEQTLLIHYNILCTGTWYLSQLLTAYRNVCDTEWTVMYPNYQHPRHTDFPIAVNSPGLGATFAWNYGGIQGVSAENFDAYHSYLVQLSIFNYECYNTGQIPPSGEISGEPPNTGETSGEPPITGGGGGGGGGGRGPKVPNEPEDPGIIIYKYPPMEPEDPGIGVGGGGGGGEPGGTYFPLPIDPGIGGGGGGSFPGGWLPMPLPPGERPPGGGAGGGGILVEPLPLPPPVVVGGGITITPVDPGIPGGNPGGGGGGVYLPALIDPVTPGDSRLPGGIIPIDPPIPTYNPIPGAFVVEDPQDPNYPNKEPDIIEPGIITAGNPPNTINPGTIGIVSIEPSPPVIVNNPSVTNYYSAERPSQNTPGGTNNPFLSIKSTSNINEVPPRVNTPGSVLSINPNTIEVSNNGNGVSQNSSILVTSISTQQALTQISTSFIDYNSFLDIETISDEVVFSQPIVLSSFFRPNNNIVAKLIITLQDESRSVEVSSTPLISGGPGSPITCGGSFVSTLFNLGPVVATARVVDSNNNIIAVKSKLIVLVELSNTGSTQTSALNRDRDIPPEILNNPNVPISSTPLYVSLPSDTSKYIVYVFSGSALLPNQMSAVLKTRYNSEDRYSITLLGNAKGKTLTNKATIDLEELGHSNSKFTINNEEVYLDTHNVGIKNVNTLASTLVVVELAPSAGNVEGDTEGWLYVSNNFYPRPVSAISSATSITADVRLASHLYGLIVHGKEQGFIPQNYNILNATSTIDGKVTWTGLSLSRGDYYSIIESNNNILNPFSKPIFQGRYI